MRTTRIVSLFATAIVLWLGPSVATPQETPEREAAERARASANDTIDVAIERRLEGKAGLEDVKIEVSWRRTSGIVTARIYGDGVGIWRETTQFQLTRDQIVGLLKAFEQARFGAMPKQYGSDDEGEESEEERERERAKEKSQPREKTFFKGIIGIRVGIEQKRVAQSMTGEQSEAFRKLAEKIVAVSEKAAKTGIGAKSMADGLSLLAAGKLAPEALQLIVRRKADRPGPGAEDGSWTLRLDGRRALDTTAPEEKASTKRLLILSPEDFRNLAAVLVENDAAGLPRNLFSPQYLAVDVRMLKDHRDISARRYAGTTAGTHGAKQAAFDRIYAALLALHARVEKDGIVLPSSAE